MDIVEFNRLMEICKQHEYIDEESLRYETQKIDGMTDGDFCKLHSYVFDNYEDSIVDDPNSSFPKMHVDYDGVRFHLMIGQGASIWTTLFNPQKDLKK